MSETWSEEIQHKGEIYQAQFTQRPFREGLEVIVNTAKGPLRISELGLGREAVLSKIKAELDNHLKS